LLTPLTNSSLICILTVIRSKNFMSMMLHAAVRSLEEIVDGGSLVSDQREKVEKGKR